MTTTSVSGVQKLRGLKNLSWLTLPQLKKLTAAMTMSRIEKRGIVFDQKDSLDSAYVLVTGIARITCRTRKGAVGLLVMVVPGLMPAFPPPISELKYNFRCEAVTDCEVGTVPVEALVQIALGITSAAFRSMAASYFGRWDLVQLRSANFMSLSLKERVALVLLELSEDFGGSDSQGVKLKVPARHRDIAQLTGASRPRVSEYLGQFERDHLIDREGHGELVVRRDRLQRFLANGRPL